MYKITPIKVGQWVDEYSKIFFLKNFGEEYLVYSYIWLIEDDKHKILVDTGYDLEFAKKYEPKCEQKRGEHPVEQLKKQNVDPLEIDYLIITHAHFDHLSPQIENYKNAQILIQKRELEYAAIPPHPWFRSFYHIPTIQKIIGDDFDDRLCLVSGEKEILEGLKVFWTGGHTPGHQAVEIKTRSGVVVLAGDAILTFKNLENNILGGINTSIEEALLNMEDIKARADIVLPGHDAEIMERFPDGIK